MPSAFTIGRTIRGTRRARHILTVLMGYGFHKVIEDLSLDSLVLKGRKLVGAAEADEHLSREPTPVRLRQAMEELGPTFVKLGQVLSTRPDLIPLGWAEEFEKLQDEVPPAEFEEVREQLDVEFHGDFDGVIRSIEPEPMAAASMAQVHRAVLTDDTPVVLKILRPGIRDLVQSDLDILSVIAEFVDEHFADLGYSPMEVVVQFKKELERELDLVLEGRSTDRLRRSFASNPNVDFPTVYWQATTSGVLALQEIKGTPLSRLPEDLPPGELECIVAHGTDAVFRQCLELGFFHADPHPGNIFWIGDGKVCFLDCGMTGHVEPDTAELLADLVHGVIVGDLNRVIDVVLTLASADPALADDRTFRADVWEFVSRFEGATFDRLDMGHLLRDFFDRVRAHRLKCPADIVFLIKAITTIEGVGERLLPSFDVVGHVRPYVERLVRKRYGIGALRRRFQDSMLAYGQLAERLPNHVRSLLYTVRKERFTVNLQHRGLDRLTDTIDRAAGNIAHAVFIASLVMGSAILVLADNAAGERGFLSVIAILGFIVALVLLVLRVVANRFHG